MIKRFLRLLPLVIPAAAGLALVVVVSAADFSVTLSLQKGGETLVANGSAINRPLYVTYNGLFSVPNPKGGSNTVAEYNLKMKDSSGAVLKEQTISGSALGRTAIVAFPMYTFDSASGKWLGYESTEVVLQSDALADTSSVTVIGRDVIRDAVIAVKPASDPNEGSTSVRIFYTEAFLPPNTSAVAVLYIDKSGVTQDLFPISVISDSDGHATFEGDFNASQPFNITDVYTLRASAEYTYNGILNRVETTSKPTIRVVPFVLSLLQTVFNPNAVKGEFNDTIISATGELNSITAVPTDVTVNQKGVRIGFEAGGSNGKKNYNYHTSAAGIT